MTPCHSLRPNYNYKQNETKNTPFRGNPGKSCNYHISRARQGYILNFTKKNNQKYVCESETKDRIRMNELREIIGMGLQSSVRRN